MAADVEIDIDAGQVVAFRSGRISGVRLDRTHRDYLATLHQDPDVMAFVGGVRSPQVSSDWLDLNIEHWHRHDFGQWLVHRDETPIGRGGLRWIDDSVGERLVEVGYVLEAAVWGQGYATAITAVFTTLAEAHYELDQLGAITLVGNDASTRVLEKNGFVFERWVHPSLGPHKFLRRRRA